MNANERRLADLLDAEGIMYEEQGVVVGHRIDFLLRGRHGLVALDANGHWWHSKPKIMACDVVKLARVSKVALVLGVWDWRIALRPQEVVAAVRAALDQNQEPPWWDWEVPKP